MSLGAQSLGAGPLGGSFSGTALPSEGTLAETPVMGVVLAFSSASAEAHPQDADTEITLDFGCTAEVVGTGNTALPTGWTSEGSLTGVWTPETKL